MKAQDKRTLEKEAKFWKSLKTLLETSSAKKCHK